MFLGNIHKLHGNIVQSPTLLFHLENNKNNLLKGAKLLSDTKRGWERKRKKHTVRNHHVLSKNATLISREMPRLKNILVKIEKRWRNEEEVGKNEEKTGTGNFPSIFENFTGRGRRPPSRNGGGGDKRPIATPLWSAFALGRNIFLRIWLLLNWNLVILVYSLT